MVDDVARRHGRRAASTTTSAAASPATRSTSAWLVPHFEKMLYDQALLARVYLHAWQVTGDARYRQVLDETIDYVLRDLRQPGGGFSSAEDADSEGEEGQFYVWTPDRGASPPSTATTTWPTTRWRATACRRAATSRARTILNRLHAPRRPGPARRRSRPPAGALFAARERPGPPRPRRQGAHRVERADARPPLAEAAAATGRADWLDAAVANGEFLLRDLRRDDGRWLRSWQADGGARHLAYAADHGALVDAFTRAGRGHRRGPLDRRGPHDRRRPARPVLGRRARRRVHHRPRRRAARHPHQGPDGQRHPGRQQPGRGRPAAPGRPHRRRPLPRPRPRPILRLLGPARRPAPHRLRPPARRRRPGGARHRPRSSSPATGPTSSRAVQRAVPARRGAGLGRALRLAAVGGPGRRARLRVPRLRLPAPRRPTPTRWRRS